MALLDDDVEWEEHISDEDADDPVEVAVVRVIQAAEILIQVQPNDSTHPDIPDSTYQ